MALARLGVVGAGWWACEFHIPHLLKNSQDDIGTMCCTHRATVSPAGKPTRRSTATALLAPGLGRAALLGKVSRARARR